jgi:FKBP-type peptidyl-prolyl cis-trans isomerase FkpA
MNRIYATVWMVVSLVFMVSCTEDTTETDTKEQEKRFFDIYIAAHYPNVTPQSSGLYYLENKVGTGASPTDTSWVLLNYVAYTLPGDDVFDTYIEKVAVDNQIAYDGTLYGPYKLHNGTINEGFTQGLTMMREGGEATFLFTSDLGFGSKSIGSGGTYSSLKYEVQLLEVLGEDIEAYEASKILAYTDTIAGVDTIYDAIDDVIMYYVVDEVTEGAPAALDSTIQVAYKGYLTDGRVFDQSADGVYYEFKVGDYSAETSPIIGWHLGLERFKLGEKGRLIIPYPLAYGANGKYTSTGGKIAIPPFETLVFDVEVISVEPVDDGEVTAQQ